MCYFILNLLLKENNVYLLCKYLTYDLIAGLPRCVYQLQVNTS